MGRADASQPVAMDEEIEAEFRALGAQRAVPAAQDEEEIEVWAANADSLDAFLACISQWRLAAGAAGALIWLGLDYAGVEVVLRRQHPADPDGVFADLQVMEAEALAVFGEVQA